MMLLCDSVTSISSNSFNTSTMAQFLTKDKLKSVCSYVPINVSKCPPNISRPRHLTEGGAAPIVRRLITPEDILTMTMFSVYCIVRLSM